MSINHVFALTQSTKYSINDLTILYSEKNYIEFFNHALDIKPVERTSRYKEMLEELGIEFLTHTINKISTKLDNEDQKVIYKISKWPIFYNNEFFNKKRDALFIREIELCFQDKKENCLEVSKQIFSDYHHDLIFSASLINLLYKNNISPSQLWPIARPLVKNSLSEFYCSEKNFREVVINKIMSDIALNSKLTITVHKDCANILRDSFTSFLHGRDQIHREAAYIFLNKYSNMQDQDKTLYHVLSFIESFSLKRKQIDKSLKHLSLLKNNHSLRSNLLKSIAKNSNYLPGELFNKKRPLNLSYSRIRILNRSFPEYINIYAKKCLDYLEGNKTFTNGNPTPYCHDLFTKNIQLKILPTELVRRYRKATYFVK